MERGKGIPKEREVNEYLGALTGQKKGYQISRVAVGLPAWIEEEEEIQKEAERGVYMR